MKIGLWNLDHPEAQSGTKSKECRFVEICDLLQGYNCDIWIFTESNLAIELEGYHRESSSKSPYIKKSRFYGKPNLYHQVAIYSRHSITKLEIQEPINGLLCSIQLGDMNFLIYGNVITLKDRNSDNSKRYSDRLEEQIQAISQLPLHHTIIGGDFNLKKTWPRGAHKKISEALKPKGWKWPTEDQNHTVQQVLHSPDLLSKVSIETSVRHDKGKQNRLSDHPLVIMELDLL